MALDLADGYTAESGYPEILSFPHKCLPSPWTPRAEILYGVNNSPLPHSLDLLAVIVTDWVGGGERRLLCNSSFEVFNPTFVIYSQHAFQAYQF